MADALRRFTSPAAPSSDFLAMCQAAGVDPDSIPDAPGARGQSSNRPIARRFLPRQHPRSPDREASRNRRHKLAGSGVLPPDLRADFTLAQWAALAIIAGEVKHHGVCDRPNDQIAALAGVSRSTVQNTLRKAKGLGLIKVTARPRPGQKNLPNLVEIVSPAWRAWIKRGPTAHRPIGFKTAKTVCPTKSIDVSSRGSLATEAPQEAVRKRAWAYQDTKASAGGWVRTSGRAAGTGVLISA
jgi:hypothetical protein